MSDHTKDQIIYGLALLFAFPFVKYWLWPFTKFMWESFCEWVFNEARGVKQYIFDDKVKNLKHDIEYARKVDMGHFSIMSQNFFMNLTPGQRFVTDVNGSIYTLLSREEKRFICKNEVGHVYSFSIDSVHGDHNLRYLAKNEEEYKLELEKIEILKLAQAEQGKK